MGTQQHGFTGCSHKHQMANIDNICCVRTECLVHWRQLILGEPSVGGSRNTEWKSKIEALNQTVSEVVAFNHAEIPDLLPPNFELESVISHTNQHSGVTTL